MSDVQGLSNADAQAACSEPDPSTNGFFMQQTMLRIKDPKQSLDFYTRVLGMRLLNKFDFPEMKFTLYFMGYVSDPSTIPTDSAERANFTFNQLGTIELTHNWGTETGDQKYHNGNSDPRGFGHIGIVVPDVDKSCARFEELGVKFIKKPNDGKMKGLAFIQDPDGYWIEILNPKNMQSVV